MRFLAHRDENLHFGLLTDFPLTRARLSGKVGAALDPCAAIQIPFELADGQEHEIVFTLGVGRDIEDAANLVTGCRSFF